MTNKYGSCERIRDIDTIGCACAPFDLAPTTDYHAARRLPHRHRGDPHGRRPRGARAVEPETVGAFRALGKQHWHLPQQHENCDNQWFCLSRFANLVPLERMGALPRRIKADDTLRIGTSFDKVRSLALEKMAGRTGAAKKQIHL